MGGEKRGRIMEAGETKGVEGGRRGWGGRKGV